MVNSVDQTDERNSSPAESVKPTFDPPFPWVNRAGHTFVRARWSGEKEGKRDGVIYVTKDGATVIQIMSQDVEPHHEHTLKLAEAAALTFKKK